MSPSVENEKGDWHEEQKKEEKKSREGETMGDEGREVIWVKEDGESKHQSFVSSNIRGLNVVDDKLQQKIKGKK